MAEDKIIEKDIPHKLPNPKTSVPRFLSVTWDFKTKSNLFTKDTLKW